MAPDSSSPGSPGGSSDDSKNQILRDLGLFAIVAGEILGYTGAGVGFGYWLWTRQGLPWWIVVLTSLAGLGMAMFQIARMARRKR